MHHPLETGVIPGFITKQKARGDALTSVPDVKASVYTTTTGARKRCPDERKRSIGILRLAHEQESRRGFVCTSLKFLARTAFRMSCRCSVTTLDNWVDGPYYGGPTDAEEGASPYLKQNRDPGPDEFDVP